MQFLIIIVVMFALMWLLVMRPQRKRQRATQQMLANIGPGDEIVTAGGLYGTVRRVADDEVTVEIAPDVEVRVARRAVSGVIPPEQRGARELGALEAPEELEEHADLEAVQKRVMKG